LSVKKTGSLENLAEALRRLPGIGPKSAQRMAYHLLQHDREAATALGHALLNAVDRIQHCSACNTFTEIEVCETCQDIERDPGTVSEVVLATNFTNEGEATAHYISETLKARGLKVSRLARGVPVGGELEYVDAGTIARAMLDRRTT